MNTTQKKRLKKMLTYFIPVLLALLFSAIAVTSISYKSRTRDESRHLVRGVMLLETGDYRLNKHHPIFANVLNAVPAALDDNVNIPSTDSELWDRAAKDELSEELVDLNGGNRDFVFNVLNPARAVTILFIAVTIIILFIIINREWGIIPAITFSLLYSFSPNILAHGRLVTTDVWIVPLVFIATYFLYLYAKRPSTTALAGFIIASFLSLITKYSAVPIAALWLILLYIFEMKLRKPVEDPLWKRLLIALKKPLLTIGMWFMLIWTAYGFNVGTLASTNHADTDRTAAHLDNLSGFATISTPISELMKDWYVNLPVPFPQYIQGFFENVILHDVYGHDSFLFGMYAKYGWWYYFPANMLVKMPVPALIGLAVLFGLATAASITWGRKFIRSEQKRQDFMKLFRLKPQHIWYIIPIFFMLLSMKSSINLGMRHILPVLPFIYLGMGLLVKKYWTGKAAYKVIFCILGLWYVISSLSVYPHYLEYFNDFVGGPKNGYRYLLDSNLTWGQNSFLVEDYIEELPDGTTIYMNPREPVENGIVIYDVDILMGRDSAKRELTVWMREPLLAGEIEPDERIANTHMVFFMGDAGVE